MTDLSENYRPPETASLQPVFEDDFLLAFDKPPGLLSVPGRGPGKSDCLSSRVQKAYPESRVVHRLDMETSGLMLFARDPETHRQLGHLFETRAIQKTYIAVVLGQPQQENGTIDAPVIADWPNRPRQKIDFENGKPSRTRFRLLRHSIGANVSRLRLHPESGRSHQLRVHLHYLGHPILGDPLYFESGSDQMAERLLLHASRLEFKHPASDQRLEISCPAPF